MSDRVDKIKSLQLLSFLSDLKLLSLGLLIFAFSPGLFSQEAMDLKQLKKHYKATAEEGCLQLKDTANGLRQIVLIRHGEPDLDKKGWRNRDAAISFMKAYDSVGVKPFQVSPVCLQQLITDTIYHSAVPRAAHTAKLAFGSFPLSGGMDFREFERKAMGFFNIKMPLKFWTVGSRVLWLMGMNKKDIESFREAKKRAQHNASFLSLQTSESNTVLLVAHGLHNKYVKKYLRKMGWKKVYDNGSGYLSVIVMAQVNP